MAHELKVFSPNGTTTYVVIRNAAGLAWNTSGSPAFEAYDPANIAAYAIAITRQSTSAYGQSDFPSGIATRGLYTIAAYTQVGGSPSATADTFLGATPLYWDGAAEQQNAPAQLDLTQRMDGTKGGSYRGSLHEVLRSLRSFIRGKVSADSPKLVWTFTDYDDTATEIVNTYDSASTPSTRNSGGS